MYNDELQARAKRIPEFHSGSINGDSHFASKLYNAILEAETTGKVVEVPIGEARRKARVFIGE